MTTGYNSSSTQAGVSCSVGKESAKYEVQFFVRSSVVKIPAERKAEGVCDLNQPFGAECFEMDGGLLGNQ